MAQPPKKPSWQGQRGSRHERGYGNAWGRKRAVIMQRDLGLCQPCKAAGKTAQAKQVDHIKPKVKGGTDHDSNLQAICIDCHKRKTADEAAEARGARVRPEIGLDGWPI